MLFLLTVFVQLYIGIYADEGGFNLDKCKATQMEQGFLLASCLRVKLNGNEADLNLYKQVVSNPFFNFNDFPNHIKESVASCTCNQVIWKIVKEQLDYCNGPPPFVDSNDIDSERSAKESKDKMTRNYNYYFTCTCGFMNVGFNENSGPGIENPAGMTLNPLPLDSLPTYNNIHGNGMSSGNPNLPFMGPMLPAGPLVSQGTAASQGTVATITSAPDAPKVTSFVVENGTTKFYYEEVTTILRNGSLTRSFSYPQIRGSNLWQILVLLCSAVFSIIV
jgi:hypothetical protein